MESACSVLSPGSGGKRAREEHEHELAAGEPVEAKRLRPQDLLDMLDDDNDASAAGDLASVMRSLEEEISAGDLAATQPELGFLLEASDDELGLPPAGSTSSEETFGGEHEEAADLFGGQIWGFEDEIDGAYGGYGVTSSPEAAAAAAAAAAEWGDDGFDTGLFGFGDVPFDLAALRHETMPAL